MEDNNSRDFDHAVDEADEALSLRDLPLHIEHNSITNSNNFEEITISQCKIFQSHNTPQHQDQFFEFLSDLSSVSDMCPADDIIFCGKLIPLTNPQPGSQGALHRRSESLSNLETYPARSNSIKNCQFLRISRSLDYQKLRRFSSSKSTTTTTDLDIQRSASIRSVGKADNKKASSKPKWYLPMFGIVKFPLEMDMRDIKSRQFRRSSSVVMFPSLDSEGNSPANRSTSSSSSWRFIKALSCSDHASVAVMTSLSVSHA